MKDQEYIAICVVLLVAWFSAMEALIYIRLEEILRILKDKDKP